MCILNCHPKHFFRKPLRKCLFTCFLLIRKLDFRVYQIEKTYFTSMSFCDTTRKSLLTMFQYSTNKLNCPKANIVPEVHLGVFVPFQNFSCIQSVFVVVTACPLTFCMVHCFRATSNIKCFC